MHIYLPLHVCTCTVYAVNCVCWGSWHYIYICFTSCTNVHVHVYRLVMTCQRKLLIVCIVRVGWLLRMSKWWSYTTASQLMSSSVMKHWDCALLVSDVLIIIMMSLYMHVTSKAQCQKCNCRQLFWSNWVSSVQCCTVWASHLNSRPKAPRGFR